VSGRDDLTASFRALMAAKRRDLGAPPTPEELLAYRDGLLAEADRERVERKIDAFPEAARALLDLEAFPDVEPAPGMRASTDEEIAAHWESFLRRVETTPKTTAPPPTPTIAANPLEPPRSRRASVPYEFRRAAVLLLTVGLAGTGGFFLGRAGRERPATPAVNVAIAELAPEEEGASRATSEAVEWPAESEGLVLVLSALGVRGYSEYQVAIFDVEGAPVSRRQGLQRNSEGTFSIGFQRGELEPGPYRLVLSGLDRRRSVELATYELRLVEE
jgi:hypothetical protein